MKSSFQSQHGILLCLVGGILVLAAGCGPTNHKQKADEQVYDFIDSRWEPEFGSPSNYRITGAPPSPNDIEGRQVEQIEKTVSEAGVLTLEQAATVALARNRDYHLQKELLYTTTLDMRLIRHIYEAQFFGGGAVLYANDGTDEQVAAEPNLGFNRLLATGALVAARVGARWTDVLTGFGDSGLAGVFAASGIQPLLRGSDPVVVREPLTQAERTALYQIRNLCRSRKALIVSVVTQYHDTLELRDRVRNAEAHVESLVSLASRVEALVDVGQLPKEELARVRQEILRAKDTQILDSKEYERVLDFLKITIGVPPTMEFGLDAKVFDVLEAEGIPYPDISLDEAVETALFRRLDLTNSADAVIDAQRAVYVAADALRPGLNIFADIELDSNGNQNAVVGADLGLPFDRVAERDQYARALVTLNQRAREYDLTADTIRMEVRQAYRTLLETAQRYQVLSEARRLAQKRVDDTLVLLSYGQASSRRVLSALEDLYDARNEAADALTDYANATLNFYRDTEVLQIRPDGMWQLAAGTRPIARLETPASK